MYQKGDEVSALIDWTVERSGTLNGIFNNAGIGLVKPFLEMDPESYHRVIDVDQHSVYYGMYLWKGSNCTYRLYPLNKLLL